MNPWRDERGRKQLETAHDAWGFATFLNREKFERAYDGFTQKAEGGTANDPNDRGKLTHKGVASASWPHLWVTRLSAQDVRVLFFQNYYLAAQCHRLPQDVAVVTFDAAIHTGPSMAQKFVQRAVGATVDGKIGPKTLGRVKRRPPVRVAHASIRKRGDFHAECFVRRYRAAVKAAGGLDPAVERKLPGQSITHLKGFWRRVMDLEFTMLTGEEV